MLYMHNELYNVPRGTLLDSGYSLSARLFHRRHIEPIGQIGVAR